MLKYISYIEPLKVQKMSIEDASFGIESVIQNINYKSSETVSKNFFIIFFKNVYCFFHRKIQFLSSLTDNAQS